MLLQIVIRHSFGQLWVERVRNCRTLLLLLPLPPLFSPSLDNKACPCCKPSASPHACKHVRKMGRLCQPSQVKREEEGGRGSYKVLQFLTLPPKAQMSGVTFHLDLNLTFTQSVNKQTARIYKKYSIANWCSIIK